MAQSLSKVLIHIIFSTKNRLFLIDDNIESKLYSYIAGICKNKTCYPVIIGGHKNHIHILCFLSKKISQEDLLKNLKQQSSIWIKAQGSQYKNFYWQSGYGSFSVTPSEKDNLIYYIKNQREHHKTHSFKDEFCNFLEKYKIIYNEQFIWD